MNRIGYYLELGLCDYGEIYHVQQQLNLARQLGRIGDTFLVLEHKPCLTIGRKGGQEHIRADKSVLQQENIKVYETNRGGDITYHGPGQLVCYPIIALQGEDRDVHAFARKMEELLLRTLRFFGIEAERKAQYPGVWAGDAKIGALGIAIRKWVTMHGVSLNICPDMRHFSLITPCGISQFGVTSMKNISGMTDIAAVRRQLRRQLEELFRIRLKNISFDSVKGMTEDAKETILAGCSRT